MANLLMLTIAGAAGYAALTRTERGRQVRTWWQDNAKRIIRDATSPDPTRSGRSSVTQGDHSGRHGEALFPSDTAAPKPVADSKNNGQGNVRS